MLQKYLYILVKKHSLPCWYTLFFYFSKFAFCLASIKPECLPHALTIRKSQIIYKGIYVSDKLESWGHFLQDKKKMHLKSKENQLCPRREGYKWGREWEEEVGAILLRKKITLKFLKGCEWGLWWDYKTIRSFRLKDSSHSFTGFPMISPGLGKDSSGSTNKETEGNPRIEGNHSNKSSKCCSIFLSKNWTKEKVSPTSSMNHCYSPILHTCLLTKYKFWEKWSSKESKTLVEDKEIKWTRPVYDPSGY